MLKPYQDLIIWQKSMELSEDIYNVTRTFPSEETLGIISQLRKATISVTYNIAEGHSRNSKKEFFEFLNISSTRITELETLVMMSRRLSYLSAKNEIFILKKINDIGKILTSLKSSLAKEI